VCEITYNEADLATMGYSTAYLFGVFGVVGLVQILMKQTRCPEKEELVIKDTLRSDGTENLAIICLAIIVGHIVGSYEIPGMNFTLGNTGGILISAIMLGVISKKYMKHVSICNGSLAIYRNFGLILFFVGTGVSSGGKINYLLDMKWFIYGALITVVTMLLGFVICHYFLRMDIEECILIIAGGMTSTPAMGVIMKNSDGSIDMSVYSATYLGAMITTTIGVRCFL
jgi:putative transport protein